MLSTPLKTQLIEALEAVEDALDRYKQHTDILSGQYTVDRVIDAIGTEIDFDSSELEALVDAAREYAEAALNSANDANTFMFQASSSAFIANTHRSQAELAMGAAAASAIDANNSAFAASVFVASAQTASNSSQQYAQAAQVSAVFANTKAAEANLYAGASATSATLAESFSNSSFASAGAAAASALAANVSSSDAQSNALAAQSSAVLANTHAASANASSILAANYAANAAANAASSQASAVAAAANAVSANSSAAAASANATLAATYSTDAGNALADAYPQVISRPILTYEYNVFAPTSVYDLASLSSDHRTVQLVVGTSAYGYGLWLKTVTAASINRKVQIVATVQRVTGTANYICGRADFFNASKAYITGINYVITAMSGSIQTLVWDIDLSSMPAGTAYIRFGVLCNRDISLAGLPSGNRTDITSLFVRDTTEMMSSNASAIASAANAVSANSSAAAASANATLAATYAGQAAANATAAQTYAAQASANAASASSSAILSAQVSAGMLNRNASFANWPTGGTIPPLWGEWSAGGTNSKVGGLVSNNAVRYDTTGTPNLGIVATNASDAGLTNVVPGGWYVMELDFTLVSGSISDAGVLVYQFNSGGTIVDSYTIDCNVDSPLGAAVTTGVPGTRYQFSKLFPAASTASYFYVYCMAAWSGFGSQTNKVIDIHKCGVRFASSQEIEARKALANTTSISATVSTHSGAIATLDGKTQAYMTTVTTAGSASASVRLMANSGGGAASSSVELQAEEISLFVGGSRVPALKVASGVSQFTGTLRVGVGASGARVEITDNLIRVYDANNVMRVRLGVW